MNIIARQAQFDFFHSVRTGDNTVAYNLTHHKEIEVPKTFNPLIISHSSDVGDGEQGSVLFINGELYLYLTLKKVLREYSVDKVPLFYNFKTPRTGWVNYNDIPSNVKNRLKRIPDSSTGLLGKHIPVFNPDKRLIDDFSRFVGQPIFKVEVRRNDCSITKKYNKIVVSDRIPKLNELVFINPIPFGYSDDGVNYTYFSGMEDPLKFYVETESYISAVINKIEVPDNRDNKIKIEAHGFDNKNSFRRAK